MDRRHFLSTCGTIAAAGLVGAKPQREARCQVLVADKSGLIWQNIPFMHLHVYDIMRMEMANGEWSKECMVVRKPYWNKHHKVYAVSTQYFNEKHERWSHRVTDRVYQWWKKGNAPSWVCTTHMYEDGMWYYGPCKDIESARTDEGVEKPAPFSFWMLPVR